MSFLFVRPYISVVENNRCPISIYNRFLIALFVLGIGLTASVIIKELPQNKDVSKSERIERESAPAKGYLESFPRDFLLNSSDPIGSYRFPAQNDDTDSQPQRYYVGKQTMDQKVSMDKEYPGDAAIFDIDERPSLPTNFNGISEEDLLKLGYRRHITVNGDKLDKLAEKYLHDPNRWKEIYNLNKDQLSNKDVIPIGIVLIIPAK